MSKVQLISTTGERITVDASQVFDDNFVVEEDYATVSMSIAEIEKITNPDEFFGFDTSGFVKSTPLGVRVEPELVVRNIQEDEGSPE